MMPYLIVLQKAPSGQSSSSKPEPPPVDSMSVSDGLSRRRILERTFAPYIDRTATHWPVARRNSWPERGPEGAKLRQTARRHASLRLDAK
jgi:hypothetical protein